MDRIIEMGKGEGNSSEVRLLAAGRRERKVVMKLVLEEGLVARPNVADKNQLLITDEAGWVIYGLVTRDEEEASLGLAPCWQLGCRVEQERLILCRQPSLFVSPFEDDRGAAEQIRQGKRWLVYSSSQKYGRKKEIKYD